MVDGDWVIFGGRASHEKPSALPVNGGATRFSMRVAVHPGWTTRIVVQMAVVLSPPADPAAFILLGSDGGVYI